MPDLMVSIRAITVTLLLSLVELGIRELYKHSDSPIWLPALGYTGFLKS